MCLQLSKNIFKVNLNMFHPQFDEAAKDCSCVVWSGRRSALCRPDFASGKQFASQRRICVTPHVSHHAVGSRPSRRFPKRKRDAVQIRMLSIRCLGEAIRDTGELAEACFIPSSRYVVTYCLMISTWRSFGCSRTYRCMLYYNVIVEAIHTFYLTFWSFTSLAAL